MDTNLKTLDQVQRTAIELAMQFGPRLVVALLVLGVGFYAARWVDNLTDRSFARLELDATVRQLLGRIVRLAVIGLFAVMALQNLGVELLPLLAGLGLAGAGVALAMQGILGNLAAGLTIIFTRPFVIGEYISIVKEEGVVEEIQLFNTVLSHADHSRVVIPNRKIVGEILHNFGRIRQVDLTVTLGFEADLGRVTALIHEVLAAHPVLLREPQPVVGVIALTEHGPRVAVRPWTSVADHAGATLALHQAVLETLRRNGIALPVPLHEVRLIEAART